MMFKSLSKKKHPYLVCYFQRSRLSIYIPDRKEVAALEFPPTILADITVVDVEQFKKAITKLLAQYKVDEGPVLIILATDVCFIQDVDDDNKKEKQTPAELIKELRCSMPYTNVFVRLINQGKKHFAIALNREFYEPLLAVFREEGFDVTTLVPELILSQPIPAGNLTAELAVQLAGSVAKLEEFDLLESDEKPKMITTTARTPAEKKQTLLLVMVFTCLTVILIGVWWWSNRATPPVKPIVPIIPAVQPEPAESLQEMKDELDAKIAASTESAHLLVEDADSLAATASNTLQLESESPGVPTITEPAVTAE